ncbi:hypothetical protein HN958_04785 [Candidatus Falkowbacteria bacterium]|mgnify:FL=1|jgi:hypothetical protein|nr:hypothetical protein [Candidatus Falkowbacteria bacterium]MBT7007786.1 hypothetical protein [Candidatus Falkowbacteria bacterium]
MQINVFKVKDPKTGKWIYAYSVSSLMRYPQTFLNFPPNHELYSVASYVKAYLYDNAVDSTGSEAKISFDLFTTILWIRDKFHNGAICRKLNWFERRAFCRYFCNRNSR